MIPKMTSHELNGILDKANKKLNDTMTNVKDIKSDIRKKLKIMRYEAEYLENELTYLNNKIDGTYKPNTDGEASKVFTLFDPVLSNKSYDSYGSTITPKIKSVPVNLFNIIASATGEAFYRDIAEISLNGVVKEEYKSILMHDSIQKEPIFEELDEVDKILDIEIKIDPSKTLGMSFFNMIELDMFLSGSYTIKSIKIYDKENTEEYVEFKTFENAGKMRIVLDKEYNLSKAIITIEPNFSTQIDGVVKYLIGIKHIYFYSSKFTMDSYAVAVIESSKFIDAISDEIIIKTPNEDIETSITEEGIQLFLTHSVNTETGEHTFSSSQEPSKPGDTKPITLNVNKIYALVPLKSRSIIGTTFEITSKIF